MKKVVIYFVIGLSLVFFGGYPLQRLSAQTLRPEEVSVKVYELLPDFPLENDYLNRESNNRDEDNTLVYRLISYHQFVKRRPLIFRFDWKLTLADYLGANETILAESYPGASSLTVNPLAGDLEVIDSLNLRQRNQLIEAILTVYQPQTGDITNPENSGESTSPTPRLPQPGDAELLKP